jgi:hypothetical protein
MSKTLTKKLDRVRELAKIIDLSALRTLPRAVSSEIENEQFRLQFRLQTLVEEARETEADLKIESMEKVVSLLKSSTNAEAKQNTPTP